MILWTNSLKKTDEQVVKHEEGRWHEEYDCRGNGDIQKEYVWYSDCAELLLNGEEDDVLTDKTISEKSEEDVTAALDDSPTDSTATNDSEIAFKTILSMDMKTWHKKYREENHLKTIPRERETIHK
uniref:Uncharacterized protein n=1 Tax=Ascaris lumbricoides TaxID=6252 RepID=A0A0M3IIZ5_ASCLU